MDAVRFRNDRVTLRALETTDVDALHGYLNHPALVGLRYLPWEFPDTTPLSRGQVTDILEAWKKKKKALTLGIELPGSEELVGHVSLSWGWDTHCPTLGVVVAPDHQCAGLGSAALHLVLGHLFGSTPAHNVSGGTSGWNEAGIAFALHHGFTVCGRVPRAGIRDGAWFEDVIVDILRPEWVAGREVSHGA
jgi:RimJ/RimL family protein N-acetyltransferase